MRLPGARALPVEAETRLRRCCASSTELLALPEYINREPPRPPQEVAHLIREPVRKSGALTLRISTRPQPSEERVQARLGAIRAPEPDRPLPDEIGHHDAIGVPLSEGDLVEPDDPGSRRPSPSQLLAHVLLLQRLDGVPV